MPPVYWVEALHTATYLLNRCHFKALSSLTPYHALFGHPPSYAHLRVFGCLYYPNLSATTPHKLAPRSATCVFIGYPEHHKGYCCLDLATNRDIISRYMIFDEAIFPFASRKPVSPGNFYAFDTDDGPALAASPGEFPGVAPAPHTVGAAPGPALKDGPGPEPGKAARAPLHPGVFPLDTSDPAPPIIYSHRPRAALGQEAHPETAAAPTPPRSPSSVPSVPVLPSPTSTAAAGPPPDEAPNDSPCPA